MPDWSATNAPLLRIEHRLAWQVKDDKPTQILNGFFTFTRWIL